MLLKISKKKKKSSPINDAKQEIDEFHADIIARIPKAYYFKGMADYQHVVPVHADIGKRKRKNCSEIEEPHFQTKSGLMDLGPKDVMMLLPPFFSVLDVSRCLLVKNRFLSSQTNRSRDFLHFKPEIVDGILSKVLSGVGSIIGVMDIGIWPESKSFRDEGMAEMPSR
ncbi:unnamed protein product [Dovyalis caffra]|uniref:Transcription factor IIIC subunit Tfc1/Sfc1 triple barrel domain-containing protein n=1 Tax=Dovyalis caffra TaxID=77055 RepID=A0AAV1SHH0_9ROSI|nr:unnamed protein product [Dovyalis caffra]